MQGSASPLVAHGLLQHETKLSVLNFAVKKDSNFTETLPNKAEMLFVTGLRSAPLSCSRLSLGAKPDCVLDACLCASFGETLRANARNVDLPACVPAKSY